MNPTDQGVQEDKTILTEPHLLPLLYVLLAFLWTGSHFTLHSSSLDERIHLQVGQEEATAARRLYEVNQYHLHEERESALRRELGEIQFEEELSLQTQQHLNHWEQEEAAAFTRKGASRREQHLLRQQRQDCWWWRKRLSNTISIYAKASHRQSTLTGQLCNMKPGFTLKS